MHTEQQQYCPVFKCDMDEGSGVGHQNHLQHNSSSFQNLDVINGINILLPKHFVSTHRDYQNMRLDLWFNSISVSGSIQPFKKMV